LRPARWPPCSRGCRRCSRNDARVREPFHLGPHLRRICPRAAKYSTY
jgi:hypothetical protein